MRIVASAAALFSLLSAGAAVAQQPLDSLKQGQQVRITDEGGRQLAGHVDAVSPIHLSIDGHNVDVGHVTKIERKGDSLWNGLAIGAGVGVLLPLLPTEACVNQSRGGCVASGVVTGALVGLAIDALHRGYTTVYRANTDKTVRVVPSVDRRARGVNVALRF